MSMIYGLPTGVNAKMPYQPSLAKWSPMASEINRDEFLGISFSHHMEILHKTKNIEEVLFCIHEAVVHQWDKYTLRDKNNAL